MLWLLARLPVEWARTLGRWSGGLTYRLDGRSRRVAERNIALVYPDLDDSDQDRLVMETLRETGALAAEMGHVWLRPWTSTKDLILRVEGQNAVKAALESGRGVIILGPHLGNWEVLGLHLATLGNMVALFGPPKIQSLGPLIQRARERSGGKLVPTTPRGIASLVKSVKAGGISGILPDQVPDSESGGLKVPFMGVECGTAALGCNLFQRSGAATFLGAAFRVKGGFEVCYLPAPTSLYGDDLKEALTAMNTSIAELLETREAQYQWQYKRFRTQPNLGVDHYRNLKVSRSDFERRPSCPQLEQLQ